VGAELKVFRRALFGLTLVAAALAGTSSDPSSAYFMVVIVAYGAVGLLLMERRPENSIGSIFLSVAVLWSFSAIGEWYGSLGVDRGWPLADLGPVLFNATFFTGLALTLMFLLALFPTGRLLSPRWRWVLWAALAFGLMGGFGNSLTAMDPGSAFGRFLVSATGLPLIVGLAGGITSTVLRYRRGSPTERHQLKWFLAAALVLPVAFVIADLFREHEYLQSVTVALGLLPIPIAVAVAVLKYRLYEIDRIISRTVTYTVVIAVLGAVYMAGLTALTAFLPSDSPLAVASSTLVAAALFNPLRRRVQEWVDRHFNRSRYDAQRVMDRFADTLRDGIDGHEMVRGWVGVVSETMQPSVAGAWVKEAR
jgi:hypothetical protein